MFSVCKFDTSGHIQRLLIYSCWESCGFNHRIDGHTLRCTRESAGLKGFTVCAAGADGELAASEVLLLNLCLFMAALTLELLLHFQF